MNIKLKMLGGLRQYLPVAGDFDRCDLDVAEGSSVQGAIDTVALPVGKLFFVMLNGTKLHPQEYDSTLLSEGDDFVLFPPVKGG